MGSVKYILLGLLLCAVGLFLLREELGFFLRSEPAQLIVVQVDSHHFSHRFGTSRGHYEVYKYRPVFELDTKVQPRPRYAGNTWMRPAPHEVGEVVSGRYDAASGVMQSYKMIRTNVFLYGLLEIVGLLALLQGVLVFYGVAEEGLPLRFRSGR